MSYPQIKLGKIADIKGGKRLPKGEELTENETEYPYIRAQDIRDGRITFDEPRYITSEIRKRIKNYTVKSKDVCITIVGANVGDVGIVPPFLDGANLTENAVKLTNRVKPLFEQIELLGKKNLNLRRTRGLLLPRLISGEVEVSELEMAGQE